MALSVAVAATALAGCTSGSADHPRVSITVSPRTAVADVPVSVRISGLPAGKTVTVTSSARQAGVPWTASAKFTVPAGGTVDLGMASTGGSYTGKDPMGLFEFMAPAKGVPTTSRYQVFGLSFLGKNVTVTLRASVGKDVVGSTSVRRLAIAPGVTTKRFRPAADGIYGNLYQPAHPRGRKPAVLVFGGSEGGLSVGALAGQLASRGYPTLALAYFAEPGLPSTLRDIPLEYFVKALKILRAQTDVDMHHVLVMGDSRGSEAALLLGAHFPKLVNAVVAGSPSSNVNGSFPASGDSGWTLHDRPLRWVHPKDQAAGPNAPGTADAHIPVWKIDGPILLVCGTADAVWPSCAYQAAIVRRLKAHNFRHEVKDLRYPGAGHYVGAMWAYFSATAYYYAPGGGGLHANTRGGAGARSALLAFLAAQD